jgi:hypothetical protein
VWDIETPAAYYVVNIGLLGEVISLREAVPADEMQHLKANVDMTWPRGLPTFWVMMPHLSNAITTLKATGKIVEFRARIGMIRRHINAAKESVQKFVDRSKEDKPARTPTAGQYPYAAIIDTSDATEYQFPAGTVPVDGNVAAIQAELRACAAALAMPEYMLSGDASNANFSSTMVAEGPAVKTFEEMQADLIDADIEIMERQLVVAAKAGLIEGCSGDEDADGYVLDMVKVEAEPPIIKSENRLQETQADQILFQAKIMSKETFAARNDLVWADEEDKIEVESENDAGYGPGQVPPDRPQLGPDGNPLPPGSSSGMLSDQQPQSSGQLAEDEDCILEVPDVRQQNHWECGAAASMAVGRYFGTGPTSLDAWATALGTTEAKSTSPAAIVAYMASLGLQVQGRENMTVQDLAASVSAGRPVICPVQDYTGERSSKALWNYGHYLTVIGVFPGYVVCQDSSIENLQREPGGDVPAGSAEKSGDISAPGRVLIRWQDWNQAWHDVGENGQKFVRFGISIGR